MTRDHSSGDSWLFVRIGDGEGFCCGWEEKLIFMEAGDLGASRVSVDIPANNTTYVSLR